LNDLLEFAVDAHGGLERWRRVISISARLSFGGLILAWDALQLTYFTRSTTATGTGGVRPSPTCGQTCVRSTRRIRPDWDITTEDMRTAWERGERDRFFPYGRRFRETWADT
jgi:hypothetical protein